MEANYFAILRLRPGRYSGSSIDCQYRSVRRQVLVSGGGPARQRRLDDAWIARCVLRDPARQARHLRSIQADVARRARRRPATPSPKAAVPPPLRRPMPRPNRANGRTAGGPTESKDACERFADLVPAYVESGLLRFTARRRLMLTAKGLGVGEFKANLIIAEVLHAIGNGRIAPGDSHATPAEPATRPPAHGYGLKLTVAAAIALAVDLLVIACLLV